MGLSLRTRPKPWSQRTHSYVWDWVHKEAGSPSRVGSGLGWRRSRKLGVLRGRGRKYSCGGADEYGGLPRAVTPVHGGMRVQLVLGDLWGMGWGRLWGCTCWGYMWPAEPHWQRPLGAVLGIWNCTPKLMRTQERFQGGMSDLGRL